MATTEPPFCSPGPLIQPHVFRQAAPHADCRQEGPEASQGVCRALVADAGASGWDRNRAAALDVNAQPGNLATQLRELPERLGPAAGPAPAETAPAHVPHP